MALSAIPGLETILAGYDVFGTYANTESTKEVLFNAGDMTEFTFQGGSGAITYLMPPWVRHERLYDADFWSKSAVTEHEYEKSMSSRTKVEGEGASFKGEVDSTFTQEQEGKSSLSYSIYEDLIRTWQLSLPNDDARTRLTAQAKADIDKNLSPADLIKKYGTHFVKGAIIGGKAYRYSTTTTSKYTSTTSLDVAAKLEYEKAAGKLSAEEEVKYKSVISNFQSSSETHALQRGGNMALGEQIYNGQYAEWAASVEGNPVLIDFPKTDALVGIWNLASTSARQAAIKAEFDSQVESRTCVKYDDHVYLQLQTATKRYLDGGRGNGNEGVDSPATVDKDTNFRWVVQKYGTSTSNVLHYGDLIRLRNESRTDRWLNGVRDDNNKKVCTKDMNAEPKLGDYYTWQVRKSIEEVGSGAVPYEEVDTGKLVLNCKAESAVYYLTGGRSDGNESVYTMNGENGQNALNYTWVIKRKVD